MNVSYNEEAVAAAFARTCGGTVSADKFLDAMKSGELQKTLREAGIESMVALEIALGYSSFGDPETRHVIPPRVNSYN